MSPTVKARVEGHAMSWEEIERSMRVPKAEGDGLVLTKGQLRQIVEDEGLSPEDIFSAAYLAKYNEAREYARQVVDKAKPPDAAREEVVVEDKKVEKKTEPELNRFLDPARNPFIKLD